ncbi:MAG: HlyD family secretion protein [Candidatus Paracaedimonas acanthamoebae]|uniref:HlyD family secretion protein n=1 Tax=Candidatus Paracaedimonas acanthamoebae TaxID=244581 RepID=A0A8J7PPB2_9PROT|nr:HlyD family secretion protein [Candidatus Paracaedimonas acanthamoebae]
MSKISRKNLLILGSLSSLLILILGLLWLFNWRYHESTDDAYVEADMVAISAKVTGYVAKIHIQDNQEVAAQSSLIEIDPVDFQAKFDEVQAGYQQTESEFLVLQQKISEQKAVILQAESAVIKAKTEILPTKRAFERSQILKVKSFASQERYDRTEADAQKAEAALKEAQANLTSAQKSLAVLEATTSIIKAQQAQSQAQLAQATQSLKETKLSAPWAGFIGNKAVQEGQLVRPGQFLMMLVSKRPFIRANFKETQITRMKPGQRVEVKVDAYPGQIFQGRIESLSPASGAVFSLLPPENATGNFTKIVQRIPVKIHLEDMNINTSFLRPGLSVIVKVFTKEG